MQKLNTTMSNISLSEQTNKQIITDDKEKKPMDIPVKKLYAYDLKKLKSYCNERTTFIEFRP